MSKENKFEKELRRRDKRATFFYDMSKIIAGGTIIAFVPAIVVEGHELTSTMSWAFLWSTLSTVVSALIADRTMKY